MRGKEGEVRTEGEVRERCLGPLGNWGRPCFGETVYFKRSIGEKNMWTKAGWWRFERGEERGEEYKSWR